MNISSAAFPNGGDIPKKYTCDGDNINPELQISGIPHDTASLLLIMEDPDAPGGIFNHWIIWNIDPGIQIITEQVVPAGGVEGVTGFGKKGYGGPCPPRGEEHRYFFRLYALSTMIELPAKSSKEGVWDLAKNHIMDQAEYMGTYRRSD